MGYRERGARQPARQNFPSPAGEQLNRSNNNNDNKNMKPLTANVQFYFWYIDNFGLFCVFFAQVVLPTGFCFLFLLLNQKRRRAISTMDSAHRLGFVRRSCVPASLRLAHGTSTVRGPVLQYVILGVRLAYAASVSGPPNASLIPVPVLCVMTWLTLPFLTVSFLITGK